MSICFRWTRRSRRGCISPQHFFKAVTQASKKWDYLPKKGRIWEEEFKRTLPKRRKQDEMTWWYVVCLDDVQCSFWQSHVFAWSSESMKDLELGKYPWADKSKGTDGRKKEMNCWLQSQILTLWPPSSHGKYVEPTVGNDGTVIIWPCKFHNFLSLLTFTWMMRLTSKTSFIIKKSLKKLLAFGAWCVVKFPMLTASLPSPQTS